MIDVTKDKKSGCYILTQTDSEGFHRQLTLTESEIETLRGLIDEIPPMGMTKAMAERAEEEYRLMTHRY